VCPRGMMSVYCTDITRSEYPLRNVESCVKIDGTDPCSVHRRASPLSPMLNNRHRPRRRSLLGHHSRILLSQFESQTNCGRAGSGTEGRRTKQGITDLHTVVTVMPHYAAYISNVASSASCHFHCRKKHAISTARNERRQNARKHLRKNVRGRLETRAHPLSKGVDANWSLLGHHTRVLHSQTTCGRAGSGTEGRRTNPGLLNTEMHALAMPHGS